MANGQKLAPDKFNYMDDDKIRGVFVRQALTKKSGEGASTLKRVVGGNSKIFTTYFMDTHEIVGDVGKLNTWRTAKSSKPPIKASGVVDLAREMQQDHYAVEAKKKQAAFEKDEQKRQARTVKKMDVVSERDAFQASVEKKRQRETKRLEESQLKNTLKESVAKEVRDMAID